MNSLQNTDGLDQNSGPVAITEPEQERELACPHEPLGALFENPGDDKNRRFGTFNGVFRPTILTILGVMMYLREGWVVGNAGLLGAILVILACYVITGTTALSISSITTNTRVGSGGAFSIISQSLGLEVGGSVGIPLYLAQGLSAALYMRGVIETWIYIFPEHPQWLVVLGVFVVSFIISYFGAKFVFKVQVGVMVLTLLSLTSIFLGLEANSINTTPILWGDFADANFQTLFAVFFPAATGIMIGASISGNLKKPRRSIPVGTMAAWGVSLTIYLALAIWYSLLGSPEQLHDTKHIFAVENALWGPIVLVGMIAACLSATLSSLVASPRVLQALAASRLVPFRSFLAKENNGDPRNATVVTGMLVFVALVLGDFNAIAQILTMFFLVIYFMINLVLFIEHRLKMISFRPQFVIPSIVPVIGALACITAILIISPLTGLLAISMAVAIYTYLDSLQLETPWETVHSGIFAGIANWAAKKVILNESTAFKRSWKPDLIMPIKHDMQLEGNYRIIRALISPRGSIQVAGFRTGSEYDDLLKLVGEFQQEGLFATCSKIEDPNFIAGMRTCISVKQGSFFRPNTIFTSLDSCSQEELQALCDMAKDNQMGVAFLGHHPESGLGRERTVNLWIRDQSPNWRLGLKLANLDFAVLMSYQLKLNWPAKLQILSVVSESEHLEMAKSFIANLIEYARLSGEVSVQVEQGSFMTCLEKMPRADINIFGLSDKVDKASIEKIMQRTRGSCLFVRDSGNESALA